MHTRSNGPEWAVAVIALAAAASAGAEEPPPFPVIDAEYCVVWRDNSAIHLVKGDRGPTGIHLFQWVRDVDAYHREIAARGAEVIVEPGDRPYDLRDFTVRDPNGVDVVFGQDI